MVEGKTKIITPLWKGSDIGVVMTKDDITGGDGEKHDILPGKAELATRTTCNVFEYLTKVSNIPLAYIGRDGSTTFLTKICNMIPVEVVVRGIATGSYLRRNPEVKEGHVFNPPIVEFYFKTSGRKLGERDLPCDDPLMVYDGAGIWNLFDPKKPEDAFICSTSEYLSPEEGEILENQLEECSEYALRVFEYLDNAWQELEGDLFDFKLEFGTLSDGEIVVADVIDCDSWRVMWSGLQLSKQGYRDGADLFQVLGIYRLAASLSDRLAR